MIKVLIGDLFSSKATTLVNTVNCVGIMGRGVALEFKNRYKDMFDDYKYRCDKKLLKPGCPYLYTDLTGVSILNFPTKDDWRSQSSINYIIRGLKWFVDNYKKLEIDSIAFPPLGCGNGGLLWEDVGPLMYKYLNRLPIDIEIYAPFGTKKELLTIDFLSNSTSVRRSKGIKMSRIKKETFCILEIINQLNSDPYAPYIGRVMYQKLCYFSTRSGLKTDFHFKKAYFGPYSDDARLSFINFSNANLILEEKKGKMDAVILTHNYIISREKFKDTIEANELIINKMVDLFSRIKNTNQAEVYSTIIFAYDNTKNKSDSAIIDYISKWKKTWATQEKIDEVRQGILDLKSIKYL